MAALAALAASTLTAVVALSVVVALVLLSDWRRPRP